MGEKPELSENLLCLSCLTYGKYITDITNPKARNYVLEILDEIQLNNKEARQLKICFDCKAMLNKCVSYREQVKDSYRILQSYSKESINEHLKTDIIRPPRLNIKQLPGIDIKPTEHQHSSVQIFVKDEEENNDIDDIAVKFESVKDELSNLDPPDDDTDLWHEDFNEQLEDSDKPVEIKTKKRRKSYKSCKDKDAHPLKQSKSTDYIKTIEMTIEDMQAEREKLYMKESYMTAEYKCESCVIGFAYDKLYEEHVWAKHRPELGDYTCPVCKSILSTIERFTTHYKRHLRRYECVICNKRAADRKLIQIHYNKAHTNNNINVQYKCTLCTFVTNSSHSLRYHKDSHKRRIQCPECDKTFSHRAGLTNHRLAIHNKNSEFSCKLCDKKFKYKPSLSKHMKIHEDATNGKLIVARCEQCNIEFTRAGSYQRHLKHSLKHVTHDQFKFICDYCGSRYTNKTKLRDHIEEKHLHKTYQCDICFKPSKNRVCLDQHIRNVHKGRPNRHMCHHCGKGFPTKEQLESHIRSHTGEKPFICEYCPTRFSQKSNLYKHNRQVHLGLNSKNHKLLIEGTDNNPVSSQTEPNALIYFNSLGKTHVRLNTLIME